MLANTAVTQAGTGARTIRIIFYAILLVGTFLRFATTDFDRSTSLGDEATYINAAHSLLANGFFTWDPFSQMASGAIPSKPTTALAPGFPFYLATLFSVIGDSSNIIISFNLIFNIGAMLMSFLIVVGLNIKSWVKCISLLFISIYPGFLYNIDRALTEQLFLFLFVSFFFFFLRGVKKDGYIWFFLAGLTIGYAIQIRAFGLPFFLLACIVGIVFRKGSVNRAIGQVTVMAAPVLAFMAVYWLYSWTVFHRIYWFPESSYGPQLWGSMPYFLEMYYADNKNLRQLLDMNLHDMPSVFWRWRVFGFFQYMWGDIWDENLVHPFWYLRNLLLLQLIVVVPTIIAIPYAIRRHQPEVLMIACVPIAFTLMNMPFHGLPRYVWPSMPFVFMTLGFIIDRLSGSQVLTFHFRESRSRAFSSLMHGALLAVSAPFAVIVAYSVYIFAWGIGLEMSEVRLLRHANTSIVEIEEQSPMFSDIVTADKVTIDNASKLDEGIFIGNDDGQPIIRFVENVPYVKGNGNVVTKLTIRSRGGHLNDFMTVYWTGKKTPEISENAVYGRFPINSLQKEHIVYIDDDVSNVLIVPAGFRTSQFELRNIQIDKYEIDKAVN